ncbi:CU044_2847 family protein [Solirubrobacter soli]|uniref:CU044_2847 family protein n=1 Tax=Solirubrobacter soli TaxID=363832 RepID=UPI0012FC866B|nr:CU044_2847 family protein [Solirubrobacter soli]
MGDIEVLVETVPVAGSEATTSLSEAAGRVAEAFEGARQAIVEVAASTVGAIDDAAKRGVRPDQLEVQFGLKFAVSGKVIVASASAEATLQIKLVYNRPNQAQAVP